MFINFKDWYRENHPSYARNMPGNNAIKEINKRLGVINDENNLYGYGKQNRWWGFSWIDDDLPIKDNQENNSKQEIKGE